MDGPPRGELHRSDGGSSRAERLAHRGRDLRPEQLDRTHDARVRQRADAELHEEAAVPEDLVLEEDLLDHLLRAADEVRAALRPRRLERRPLEVGGQPRSRPMRSIVRLNAGNASSAARCDVSATKPCELIESAGDRIVPGLDRRLPVILRERREPRPACRR